MHNRPRIRTTLFLISTFALGCSIHTIRPGIWELNLRLTRSDNGEVLQTPRREVRVEVEWQSDPAKPNVAEIFGISTLGGTGETGGLGPAPMYGDLETPEERQAIVRIEARDPSWIWRMGGVVIDSGTIQGTRLDARPLRSSGAAFEGGLGSWSMKWLRDE